MTPSSLNADSFQDSRRKTEFSFSIFKLDGVTPSQSPKLMSLNLLYIMKRLDLSVVWGNRVQRDNGTLMYLTWGGNWTGRIRSPAAAPQARLSSSRERDRDKVMCACACIRERARVCVCVCFKKKHYSRCVPSYSYYFAGHEESFHYHQLLNQTVIQSQTLVENINL